MNNTRKIPKNQGDLLKIAVEYHRDGVSVFPTEAGTKRPAIINGQRLSWEPFQQQKATTKSLRAWFGQDGVGGIAVVCGKVSNGLIVIDFDGDGWDKAFDRFIRAFPKLEQTKKVVTGSGRLHLWLRCPDLPEDLTRKVRKFEDINAEVELRANRHYVLAPPSLHPNGRRYEWLNPDTPVLELSLEELEEIIAWFEEGKDKNPKLPPRITKPLEDADYYMMIHIETGRIEDAAEYYLDRAISTATPGTRNDTGFWLACQLRDLRLPETVAESYMRRYAAAVPQGDEPYTEDEALTSLKSAYKGAPREPAIPGVRRSRKFTPAGRVVEAVDIDPKIVDILIQHPASEPGNAETFRDLFGDQFCYVKEKGSWFWFDGIRWIEADEKAYLTMLEVVRLRRRAAGMLESDDPLKDELEKWTRQCEKYKIRVNHSLGWTANYIHRNYTEFDTDPWLLCCANGVVDLRTGELRPAKPDDMLHKSTGIRYDPTATCPRWERFLREIFLDDEDLVDFIHRAVGYTLTGLMPDMFFICYGTGSNGKSIFLTVLEQLLGEYSVTATPATFVRPREISRSAPSPDLAELAGARFAKCVEVRENIRLDEERVKALTGGEKIRARFLFQNSFEFSPTAKLWWAVNHKPIIRDTTYAMWRRIRLIPFEARFDPELGNWQPKEELLAELEAELPGILAWAVKGCLEWQEQGLEPVEKVKTATETYRKESDVIERFLEECTVQKPEAKVKASTLYQEFKKWAEENGELTLSSTSFGRRMGEKGFTKKRLMDGVHYLGLGLLARDEQL